MFFRQNNKSMAFTKIDLDDLFDDSRFTTLITYDEGSESFDVNIEGVLSILSVDGPLRVHSCIGRDPEENSKFMGNILDFAVTEARKDPKNKLSIISGDLKEILLKRQKEVKKKSIVAWNQAVPGLLLEGKRVHHAFLNLWGEFRRDDEDDRIYSIMAGIMTAISSSVVYIQKSELQVIKLFAKHLYSRQLWSLCNK